VFCGLGKSYFGKISYFIANPNINGTSARDRFMPRLAGENENFIKNDILSLD
jgi:hypothetical protein